MPRNSSGVYSLPESPFTPGTTIESAPVNSNFDDIADALTGSLPVDGSAPMTAPLEHSNGSISAPSITFTNSSGTGWYRISNNVIGFVVAGTLAYSVDTNRVLDMEVGLRVGNAAFVDTTVLDWYEEGTFTPIITYEGTTTGITYTTQTGAFTRIGDTVFFSLLIVLSNAGGGSANDVFVDNLPYPCGSLVHICNFVILDGFNAAATGTTFGRITNEDLTSGDIILFYSDGENAFAIVGNNLQNTAAFRMTGHYKVA